MKTSKILTLALLSCCLHIIPVYSNSESLLKAWKEINENYANDIQQSNNMHDKIKEELHALNELLTIVERHLRDKNAEILANALSSNDVSISEKNIREITKNITESNNNEIVDSIFAQTIDEVVSKGKLLQLPDMLSRIYQKDDLKYYEILLRFQIQLYRSFSSKHHNDEKEFLQTFAYRLYKTKNKSLYASVDLDLKSAVQNIVDKLPTNLKYLYFMPHFCLLNEKYEKYIYTAIEAKVDPVSRYIWLWFDNKSMDDTGYISGEITEHNTNNKKQLKVVLKGTKYKMFYYMMPSTKMIAGWDTTSTPTNYIWDIEFLDNDRVVFSQNDYLMCAIESHDNERRNVGGLMKDQVSSASPECQWRLGECIFK